MENTNVLKTAVGVGILGTVAVYLGYSYFNEDIDGTDVTETPTTESSFNETTPSSSVSEEVTEHLEGEKLSAFGQFFQNAYKSMTDENHNDENGDRDNTTDYN